MWPTASSAGALCHRMLYLDNTKARMKHYIWFFIDFEKDYSFSKTLNFSFMAIDCDLMKITTYSIVLTHPNIVGNL